MTNATDLLRAIVEAWDAPHYGDLEAARDSMFEPIEAARAHLAECALAPTHTHRIRRLVALRDDGSEVESYSGPITIYERNGWKLESYGRGAAYTLWHGNASVFFQGDDATAFREAVTGPDGFLTGDVEARFAEYLE